MATAKVAAFAFSAQPPLTISAPERGQSLPHILRPKTHAQDFSTPLPYPLNLSNLIPVRIGSRS